ncbi:MULTISPECIES: urease subunit beta [unclassified Myroides]|uniref:urease subunit beta n=1 Tax=unclassified Myroides TaxID=2642485 RepID=UPI0015FD1631|nr:MULTISPECIES: urease subunit beta [unclassified Myroides]MBB1149307.1 urease subunit beta [Myroides sp. NP-2]MDM1406788.1 urease subunit beta [Myroides sp. DF42-4-2]
MYLTHQEKEKMLLLFAAIVAKSRKEKGLKLSYPEAVAYLSGHIIEGAREGKTVQQLIGECNQLLTCDDVMQGVPELIEQLQVEAMFVDGTKLVSLNSPIPSNPTTTLAAGAYSFASDDIELSAGRKRLQVSVVNTADRPVQVGSHFHFYEVNPALHFDREKTKGYHLDIASGLSIRFMPGVTETVDLVAYAGEKIIHGFTGKINGSI